MRAVDIIQKKRDKQPLSEEEIRFFVNGITSDAIPDYQASALLMAIFLNDMNRHETVTLTMAMAASGQMMDLSDISDYIVDKHSSGGVGDKTTLVVLPLVAACGVPVAKMSGRGLGFSGGTLDKMESFSGYNIYLSDAEFHQQAREHGIVLAGQTGELAPADGKLYALRDVTATIESIPLIAASIMSKKLAAGANGIVLDVKWGNGAFMPTLESARNLAHVMVDIGKDAGRDVIAVLSDMNQPLGNTVGNALEVREAIECLHGAGPKDFREHCLEIATRMMRLEGHGEKWTDDTQTRLTLTEKLDNGEALAKFRKLVEIQGGDVSLLEHPEKLPHATYQQSVYASQSGYIQTVTALEIAKAALALGAGREKKGDTVDLSAGIEIFINVGDEVNEGDKIAVIHANDERKIVTAGSHIKAAVTYSESPVEPLALFHGIIT